MEIRTCALVRFHDLMFMMSLWQMFWTRQFPHGIHTVDVQTGALMSYLLLFINRR